MPDKKLVLSIFESEAAADEAVKFMTSADLAKNDASIGASSCSTSNTN